MPAQHLSRRSSSILAASAGAAVCLSGGGAAHAVTGNIAASNAGSIFSSASFLHAFDNHASWFLYRTTSPFTSCVTTFGTSTMCGTFPTSFGGYTTTCTYVPTSHRTCTTTTILYDGLHFSFRANTPLINGGPTVALHNAGVTVNAGMAGGFGDGKLMPGGASNKYIAAQFSSGGTKYGWLHVVSSDGPANHVTIDKWGYDATGGDIRTLAGSVRLRELPLADGRIQLRWNNADELGVARYEVQQRGNDGVWATAASEAPGAGRYAVTLPRTGAYRLRVEKTDGSVELIKNLSTNGTAGAAK